MSFETWADNTEVECRRAAKSPCCTKWGRDHDAHKFSVNQQIQGGHGHTPPAELL